MSQVNLSERTPERQRSAQRSFVRAIPVGVLTASVGVACGAFNKKNRADTFVKTAKSCAKDYAVGYKDTFSSFFGELLGMKKFGNKIAKLGNKKAFAIAFALDSLLWTFIGGAIGDFIKNR